MIARHPNSQVGEQLAVLSEILRDIVRLEEVLNLLVGPSSPGQIGDLLNQIEGEGVTGRYIVNRHFNVLVPKIRVFLAFLVSHELVEWNQRRRNCLGSVTQGSDKLLDVLEGKGLNEF
jgi:hypothetical protein